MDIQQMTIYLRKGIFFLQCEKNMPFLAKNYHFLTKKVCLIFSARNREKWSWYSYSTCFLGPVCKKLETVTFFFFFQRVLGKRTFDRCLCVWVWWRGVGVWSGWCWGLDALAHPSATILWPCVTCLVTPLLTTHYWGLTDEQIDKAGWSCMHATKK